MARKNITINDGIKFWKHYGNPSVMSVMIDIKLASAETDDTQNGMRVKENQVYTSISTISANTHLAPSTVSKALDELVKSGDIIKSGDRGGTLITIINYQIFGQQQAAPIVEKPSNKFVKPTIAEIEEFCNSRNNGIDAKDFYFFYESKGWKVGKTPMKDWHAAVFTWERMKSKKAEKPKKEKEQEWQT